MIKGSNQAARSLLALLIGGALLLPAGFEAAAQQDSDPDWPCVQRLLPEIASGMIWAGPSLDEVEVPSDDQQLAALAQELAARRVPIEDAEIRIEAFAASLDDDDKAPRLSALFKATLDIINKDRASIIGGIKKFSRGQRALADKITAKNEEIKKIASDDVLTRDTAKVERDWDIRVFEDRRRSLTYLCEQPVLLEQRAFALARTIAGHLE